ncbi:Ppx/GppA family phosphatase [Erythrobacter litoralis]|uniref:Ppx/GppA family phosphatase n=1 Tax=Erythrobacter litoralis TaxID=39960 RepID=UPI002435C44E|nr:Ppx/GppA family phosphatase [Erythrobacter litoralis]MDG6078492.1 Ppx/GppA family phosphatase [Erythrobacter litoralis]
MSSAKIRSAKWQRRLIHPPRAVIDIGSNTVRLVIYEGPARAPEVVWNEKVAARLGRDLNTTGRIPDEAMNEALDAIARFKLLVADRNVTEVQVVATAAAREAENGAEFLARVAELGLQPRLLSGEEEARASAMGAIGAFPEAKGVVADLGGGSLELVSIGDGTSHQAVSLPLGTLRLIKLRERGKIGKGIAAAFDAADWKTQAHGPLYMIGGTWRAFAHYAMRRTDFPLTDPHEFRISVKSAARLAKAVADTSAEELETISGISSMRACYLPDAAALLRHLIERLEPTELVFSSWGLREGLLVSRLSSGILSIDPLLASVHAFAEPRDAHVTDAARMAGWTADVARGDGARNERLRLAAAHLSLALQRVEPNLRASHASEWALDKRWIACEAHERAMICAALYGSIGKTDPPASLAALANEGDIREGTTWGLSFRLARRLGAGSQVSLANSRMRLKKKTLALYLDESRAALATYPLTKDLDSLAQWLGHEPRIKIGAYEFDDPLDELDDE